MGRLLQAAEQQGILDARLVVVTHAEYCSAHSPSSDDNEDLEVCNSDIHVHSWANLEGKDLGWYEREVHVDDHDTILQVCSKQACRTELSFTAEHCC